MRDRCIVVIVVTFWTENDDKDENKDGDDPVSRGFIRSTSIEVFFLVIHPRGILKDLTIMKPCVAFALFITPSWCRWLGRRLLSPLITGGSGSMSLKYRR